MVPVRQVQVRRLLDGSRRPKPLRIAIGRRRIGSQGGDEKFVTQVQLGGGEAIVVPWTKSLGAARRAESPAAGARLETTPASA